MRDVSGRSKGCGIVEYRTTAEAQQAINTLLDTELKGRLIFVREDREAAGRCGGGRRVACMVGGGGAGKTASFIPGIILRTKKTRARTG